MSPEQTSALTIPHGRVTSTLPPARSTRSSLDDPATEFVPQVAGAGLVRMAVPLGHYQSHFLETWHPRRARRSVRTATAACCAIDELTSGEGTFPIEVEVRLRPSD